VALLVFSTTLVLVARAKQWKPKPIKLAWVGLVIFGAVFIAGAACSIAGRDIHILYWWLAGAPATVALIAVLGGVMNFLVGWLSRKRREKRCLLRR